MLEGMPKTLVTLVTVSRLSQCHASSVIVNAK